LEVPHRAFECSSALASSAKESRKEPSSLIHIDQHFQSIPKVERNKDTFLAAIAAFKEKKPRGHVEFINTALKYIKEYGIHKDLDVYKALLDVFPKGKMIPQNTFQRIFLHYPVQQNCCVKVLDEMEWNGVQPDKEIHDIVVNAFGEWNFATKKVKRMLYWMPKLKYSNKYLDRRDVEGKSLSPPELAGIALKMMSRDPGTELSLTRLAPKGPLDQPWFVIAQSLTQKNLIRELHEDAEVFIDGPYKVYVMDHQVEYIVMTGAPFFTQDDDFKHEEFEEDFSHWFTEWKQGKSERKRSVHEQKHETILAMGALYRNDNKTASLWLERLHEENPSLKKLKTRLRLDKDTKPSTGLT
ncbi:ECSIT protein, partial [Ancylostoma caninum]